MRTSNKSTVDRFYEKNPNWFKVRLEGRRLKENGKKNIEYAYTSGLTVETVKTEMEKSLGLDHIVKVKQVEYDQIIQELDR